MDGFKQLLKGRNGNMGQKGEQAKCLFEQGYNCAQSVVGAFAEDLGLEFDLAVRLVTGFGGGMGRLREVCGAVSGMIFAADIRYGINAPGNLELKKENYQMVQELAHRFEERQGSIICRELLGLSCKRESPEPEARTPQYYKKRPCGELIRFAADTLDEYLKSREL